MNAWHFVGRQVLDEWSLLLFIIKEGHGCDKILFFSLFCFFERERAGEGQREREIKNPKQAPHCQRRARCGL